MAKFFLSPKKGIAWFRKMKISVGEIARKGVSKRFFNVFFL